LVLGWLAAVRVESRISCSLSNLAKILSEEPLNQPLSAAAVLAWISISS